MASIFISHASKDNKAARALRDWLAAGERGYKGLFLDFDPERGLKGGENWKQGLYDSLHRCQAVIALLSEHWLASKWCFAEAVQARGSGKKLIFAKIAKCPKDRVFDELQHIDLSGAGYPKAEGYRRLEIALADTFDWTGDRPPYPGLPAFDEQDAAIFFGREDETRKAAESLARLRRNQPTAERFQLILGASGSGKSSLMRAGIIPRLKREGTEWLVIPPFVAGGDPFGALAASLVEAFGQARTKPKAGKLRSDLMAKDKGAAALYDLLTDLRLSPARGRREAVVLIAIDQLDDLTAPTDTAEQFWRLLRATLERGAGQILAMGTLRSDLMGRFQEHPGVAAAGLSRTEALRYETFTLDPLPYDRFRTIVLGPGERAGLQIEPKLVDRMVEDSRTSDALPLLAFVLNRLWLGASNRDPIFTLHDYEAIGGIASAVSQEADAARAAVLKAAENPDATDKELQALFIPGLVELKDQDVLTRSYADLSDSARALLQPFLRARLLVTDSTTEKTERNGRTVRRERVRVAHEAMLRNWTTLKRWIEKDRSKLAVHAEVVRDAEDWERDGQTEERLNHRDSRLQMAESVFAEPRFGAAAKSGRGRAYLHACRARQTARESTEREAADEIRRRVVEAQLSALEADAERNFARANFNSLLAGRTQALPPRPDKEAYVERLQKNEAIFRSRAQALTDRAFQIKSLPAAEQFAAFAPVERREPGAVAFSVEALRARHGTALLIHYGTESDRHLVLYGGGPVRTFNEAIQPALMHHASTHGLPRPRLDLILLPEQDDNYLRGIVDLFTWVEKAGGKSPVEIGGLWHNHFAPMIDAAQDANWSSIPHYSYRDIAPIIARRFGISVNEPFDYFVAAAEAGSARVALDSGLSITVMGPTPRALERVHRTWKQHVGGRFEQKAQSVVDQIGGFIEGYSSANIDLIRAPTMGEGGGLDLSVVNQASMRLLLEFAGRRILLCGDANGEQIIAGLLSAGALKPGSHVMLDAMLLPHNGSRRNVSVEFFQQVRADHYIISGNGAFHGVPDPETFLWLLEARAEDDRPFSIHLTYGLEEIEGTALVQLEKDAAVQHKKDEARRRMKQRITRREAPSPLPAVQSGKLQRLEVRERLAAAIQAGRLRGIFAPEHGAVSTVIDLIGPASRPSCR